MVVNNADFHPMVSKVNKSPTKQIQISRIAIDFSTKFDSTHFGPIPTCLYILNDACSTRPVNERLPLHHLNEQLSTNPLHLGGHGGDPNDPSPGIPSSKYPPPLWPTKRCKLCRDLLAMSIQICVSSNPSWAWRKKRDIKTCGRDILIHGMIEYWPIHLTSLRILSPFPRVVRDPIPSFRYLGIVLDS